MGSKEVSHFGLASPLLHWAHLLPPLVLLSTAQFCAPLSLLKSQRAIEQI